MISSPFMYVQSWKSLPTLPCAPFGLRPLRLESKNLASYDLIIAFFCVLQTHFPSACEASRGLKMRLKGIRHAVYSEHQHFCDCTAHLQKVKKYLSVEAIISAVRSKHRLKGNRLRGSPPIPGGRSLRWERANTEVILQFCRNLRTSVPITMSFFFFFFFQNGVLVWCIHFTNLPIRPHFLAPSPPSPSPNLYSFWMTIRVNVPINYR